MNIESESTTFSRGKRKRPFFTSYCHVAQDCNLSIEARGLLFYYLSFPEDWKHHFEKVSSENQIGKDKLQRLNKELIKAGYMISWQEKKKNGVWGSHHYEIFDDKEEAAERLKELESEKKYNDILSGEKQEKPSHIESEPLPCFPAAGKSGYILNNKDNKKEIPKGIKKDSVTASSFPPEIDKPKRLSRKCRLSVEERQRLSAQYGEEALKTKIQQIEDWIEMHAKPGYASWLLAIHKWFKIDREREFATSRSSAATPPPQVRKVNLNAPKEFSTQTLKELF